MAYVSSGSPGVSRLRLSIQAFLHIVLLELCVCGCYIGGAPVQPQRLKWDRWSLSAMSGLSTL